jgi:hypothetical protein
MVDPVSSPLGAVPWGRGKEGDLKILYNGIIYDTVDSDDKN